MEQVMLNIKGMSCAHCKAAVTNALNELQGVQMVEVDLEQGKANVTYDASKVTIEKMKEAVEEQGYDVV